MSDFTTLNLNYNTGSDASPSFTGTPLAFGGTSGANELRFSATGAGGTSVASAAWPFITRPSSGTATVGELWAYTTDTSGAKVATYDGTNGKANVLRWSWDNLGTFAAAPQFTWFNSSAHSTPTIGDGSLVGGSSDTSNTSYFKGNAFGFGTTATSLSAGAAGSTLSVTSGTAGSVSPGSAAWLATWQSLQGWVQYILDGAIPPAVTAQYWYFTQALFAGVNVSTGTFTPTLTFQYSYS